MAYAVAALDAVLVYDTQQHVPIAHLSNLHYDKVNDLAWAPDGKRLVMASQDGMPG
jgi:WD40 repeat protein